VLAGGGGILVHLESTDVGAPQGPLMVTKSGTGSPYFGVALRPETAT
jgi:hypothetical protein